MYCYKIALDGNSIDLFPYGSLGPYAFIANSNNRQRKRS